MLGPKFRRIPAWAYLLVVFTLTINVLYIIGRFNMPVDGIGTKLEEGHCMVHAVRPESPGDRAGIKSGDELVSMDGQSITALNHLWFVNQFNVGDVIEYQIIREKKPIILSVKIESFWSQQALFFFFLYLIVVVVIISSLFLLYKKPHDFSVKLFFIYLQLFSIAQNGRFLFFDQVYANIATAAFILSFCLFGVVLMHFHLIFPKPAKMFSSVRNILISAYIIGFLLGFVNAGLMIYRNYSSEIELAFFSLKFSRWALAWMGLTLSLALAIAVYQYFTTRESPERKQLRTVITGTVFGIFTPILFSIYPEFIWLLENENHLLNLVDFTHTPGSYIMIAFLLMAIFRYRMWDIEPFIKKAILYTAATAFVLLTYLCIIFIINLLAIQLTSTTHFIIMAGSILTFLLLRDLMQRFIERLFQREPYDSASVVSIFEEKLAGIYNFHELNVRICQGINDIFHNEFIILARKKSGNQYEVDYQTGDQGLQTGNNIYIDDNMSTNLAERNIISFDELQHKPGKLEHLSKELIIPLIEKEGPGGFIILGNKLSEQSYTHQDIRVLSLLSRRIAALFHTAMLYQKDLERQLMLERERTRISQDMHDDVGASLTRIAILSDLTNNRNDIHGEAKQWLSQISETSRSVMEQMGQIIWALNPKNDSLDGLVAYLRRFATEYLEPTDIRCNFDLGGEMPGLGMSVEVRRNVYLVFREALHNLVKHSGASQVRILIKTDEKKFLIIIADDGKGFDPAKLESPGNGLINMKKRMKDIGGGLLIKSEMGKGTEVQIDLAI